jgi:hypothetical protein
MRQRKQAKKKTAFVPRSLFRALAGGTVIPVCVLGGAVSGFPFGSNAMLSCAVVGSPVGDGSMMTANVSL